MLKHRGAAPEEGDALQGRTAASVLVGRYPVSRRASPRRTRLGIRKEQIAKRQAWQNYLDTQFNVQRRMADWHFAQAQSWTQLREMHDRWVADFNFQQHWAHRARQDDPHSPSEVLGWVYGTVRTDAELDRVFRRHTGRRINAAGYVRYRCWRLYAERGLARQAAEVWLMGETLTIEHAKIPLSQFTVAFQPDQRHFRQVKEPRLFDHPFPSPQPLLWPADAMEWHLVRRVPPSATRRPHPQRQTALWQPPLRQPPLRQPPLRQPPLLAEAAEPNQAHDTAR